MRKLALLVALLAVPLAPVHGVTLVDRIVAVVNKEVITYSELSEAVGMAERQLRRQGTPAPERPRPASSPSAVAPDRVSCCPSAGAAAADSSTAVNAPSTKLRRLPRTLPPDWFLPGQ